MFKFHRKYANGLHRKIYKYIRQKILKLEQITNYTTINVRQIVDLMQIHIIMRAAEMGSKIKI